VSYIENILYTA